MQNFKWILLRAPWVFFLLSLSLSADDTRLLVISIIVPPKDVVLGAEVGDRAVDSKITKKIERFGNMPPDKFAKKMVKGLIPADGFPASSSGLMALYGGYSAFSDENGLINFPLRHSGEQVDVIFTPNIDLERLYKETYSGIFINQKAMCEQGYQQEMLPQRYSFIQKPLEVVDEKAASDKKADTGGTVMGKWEVSESTVGMDTRLPADSVIILVNPKNIFVPRGIFTEMVKPHVLLPDMYLIGKKFNDEILLNNQQPLSYFERIKVQSAKTKDKKGTIEQVGITNE